MGGTRTLIAIDEGRLLEEVAALRQQNERILELLSGTAAPGGKPKVRLLRVNEVLERVGFKKTTLFEAIKAGRFPEGFKHGNLRLWRESEVDAAIEALSGAAGN